jgi:MFS family permease
MRDGHAERPERGRRRRGLLVACLGVAWSTTLLAAPAFGQTSAEAYAVVVEGGDSGVRFRGLAGGGGILFWNRLGLDGEYGLMVDNSDERSLAPMVSGGASLRFPIRGKLSIFVGSGLVRLGDVAGPYVGGGANYWLTRAAALRVELRTVVPGADYRGCSTVRPTPCVTRSGAWFVRAGVAFGVAR